MPEPEITRVPGYVRNGKRICHHCLQPSPWSPCDHCLSGSPPKSPGPRPGKSSRTQRAQLGLLRALSDGPKTIRQLMDICRLKRPGMHQRVDIAAKLGHVLYRAGTPHRAGTVTLTEAGRDVLERNGYEEYEHATH